MLDLRAFNELLNLTGIQPLEVWLQNTTPSNVAAFIPAVLRGMIDLMTRKLSLHQIKPTQHIAFNRYKKTRRLTNFEEMVDAVNKKVSGAHFNKTRNPPRKVPDQARYFSRTQCVLAVRGALLTNVIWMQKETAIIEIQGQRCDDAYNKLARFCGIRVLEIGFPIYTLHQPFPADIPIVVEGVRRAFHAFFSPNRIPPVWQEWA
jgi:hypothetical protein